MVRLIMLETDLNLTAEIKLYYDLYTPKDLKNPAPLLIAVHGYGAHKRYMMREARLVAPENFVIASLQAPFQHFREANGTYKVGFGWLTDYKADESILLHHNFVLEVIEKLASNKIIDTKKIYFYGFSQACALNFFGFNGFIRAAFDCGDTDFMADRNVCVGNSIIYQTASETYQNVA